jgi:hypothetical protein
VDFVVETPGPLLPVEVKSSAGVAPADAKGLEAFLDEYPDLADGGLFSTTARRPSPTRRTRRAWWKVI